ncbi:MAG: kynureninase, partial [Gemmatimonadetes bacterium]
KYLQMGEGAAFLRVPPGARLRPVITGWFAEFADLAGTATDGTVAYGAGADAFAGATYDPTPHYRAAAVLDFFDEQGMSPQALRGLSRAQIARLAEGFDALDLDPALVRRDRTTSLERIGGFLALESPRASDLHAALLDRGVLTDFRDTVLRLGPAPYVTDAQLDTALAALGEACRTLS